MNKGYFILFSSCIPVNGSKRNIICDLQRSDYEVISSQLYNLLLNYSYIDLEKTLKEPSGITINKEINFLLEKEYGFITATPENFPKLDLTWNSPRKVSNAIIDIGKNSQHDFGNLFSQLDSLGCPEIQLRFFNDSDITLNDLNIIASYIENSRIKIIDLIIPYRTEFIGEKIELLIQMHSRLNSVTIHSSPSLDIFRDDIVFIDQVIYDETHCGIIHPLNMRINQEVFLEAQQHNTCLNRKISIDQYGEIKNCPAMKNSFGHIDHIKLEDIIKDDAFREAWTIKKDDIDTCKDCEFRYICSDCRAFTQDNTLYAKPSKCHYDPNALIWREVS
ncbi:grasp-with-spasm system SPASM domain peptide maturase [Agarilytica rhodophyticola]|uniref:grasp-with-spasm system SPASM domain peptide maturase n=1 Tax=Agarilytica rhodophyticola TaxID=1737490 RepID=UPI001319D4FD|nr:grasp-with-spasm system SPASM domain peptide maturase [Agarilytica rhodophyticola]